MKYCRSPIWFPPFRILVKLEKEAQFRVPHLQLQKRWVNGFQRARCRKLHLIFVKRRLLCQVPVVRWHPRRRQIVGGGILDSEDFPDLRLVKPLSRKGFHLFYSHPHRLRGRNRLWPNHNRYILLIGFWQYPILLKNAGHMHLWRTWRISNSLDVAFRSPAGWILALSFASDFVDFLGHGNVGGTVKSRGEF
jgi:hypothetical protein